MSVSLLPHTSRALAYSLGFLWILIAPTAVLLPAGTGLTWSVTVIDTVSTGPHTSLLIASNGTTYVSYLDDSKGLVKLATLTGTGWSTEIVDGPGSFSGDTSLGLDSAGNLHLVYFDALSSVVRYGTRPAHGGSWNLSALDRGLSDGFNRLAVDRFGVVHVVYVLDNGSLRYAYKTDGFWVREYVDPSVLIARYVSIAVDRNGRPHLAYYGNGKLRYASTSGVSWSIEIVDPRDYVGWFASIAIDLSGFPHIAYYDSVSHSLNHAVRFGTSWSRDVIDASGDAGWDISVVTGPDDVIRVAYYARIPADLRYAELRSGVWEVQTVDDEGVTGWSSSIALNSTGSPRVTYFDWSHGFLKYAVGLRVLGTRTVGPSSVTESSAILLGEVTSLGPYGSANVSFNWRQGGMPDWHGTPPVSLAAAAAFNVKLDGLQQGTRYEFRAVAQAGGETAYGATVPFVTGTPPTANLPLILLVVAAGLVAFGGIALFARLWYQRR